MNLFLYFLPLGLGRMPSRHDSMMFGPAASIRSVVIEKTLSHATLIIAHSYTICAKSALWPLHLGQFGETVPYIFAIHWDVRYVL